LGESSLSEPLGFASDATSEPPEVLQQAAEEFTETNIAPFGESTASEPPDALLQAAEEDLDPNLAPPEPLDMLMGESPSLDTEQDTSFAAPQVTEDFQDPDTESAVEPTLETDIAPLETVTPEFMEEMNFPARVVKLKMANEKIRSQIEALEKPLFAPIVVSAPAAKAKGKGKEETKPSKGH
jgi:phytoene dehydrogenase-like protein